MSELATRSIVGLGLVTLAGGALWLGGTPLWVVVGAAGLMMLGEWAGLRRATPGAKRIAQIGLAIALLVMAPFAFGTGLVALWTCFVVAALVAILARPALGWGVAYVALPVLALLRLRAEADGLLLAFWAMSLVWATDIGAYFTGRTIGGPKLAPMLSPNKTWAGLVGGMIAATGFAFLLHVSAHLPFRLVIATPLLAVLAQAGDLYESWLKRCAGVKDSGRLLPGHGGLLDRLDGLVPVAPVAALIVTLWLGR